MKHDPPRIYLAPKCEQEAVEGRTWCEHDQWSDGCEDCGEKSIAYVRSDLIDKRFAAIREAVALRDVEAVHALAKNDF